MIRNTTLLAFFTGILFTANSQTEVFNYSLTNYTASPEIAYLTTVIADEQKNRIIIDSRKGEFVEYLVLSDDFKNPVRLGTTATNFSRRWLVGSTINNSGYNFIYCSDYPKQYSETGIEQKYWAEIIDPSGKTISTKEVFVKPKEEEYIAAFNIGNRFYFLTCHNKNKQFTVSTLDENNALTRKSFYVDLKDLMKSEWKLSDYFGSAQVFSPDEETDFISSVRTTKVFPYADNFVITTSTYDESPHIIKVDLKSMTLTKKIVPLDGFCGPDAKKKDFWSANQIYRDRLYVINVCRDQVVIGIFNPASLQLIKKFEIKDLITIPIAELPTQTVEKGKKNKDEESSKDELLDMKGLLKALRKYQPGIVIGTNDSSQVVINCGSYDRNVIMKGGGGYYRPVVTSVQSPTGQTYAGSNVPVTRTTTQINSRYVESRFKPVPVGWKTHATTFSIVVDPVTFNAIKTSNTFSKRDGINLSTMTIPADAGGKVEFKMQGKTYYGFVPSSRKFTIWEISAK